MQRTAYVVRDRGLFLRLSKKFSYADGNMQKFTPNFQHARLFNRRVDAEGAAYNGGVVVEVTITLQPQHTGGHRHEPTPALLRH